MASGTEADEVTRLAQKTLGFEQLRPGQLQAIEAVTSGRDTLAVMSTGYGSRRSTSWPASCSRGRRSSSRR